MDEAIDAQFDGLISYRESTRQYREAEASQEMGLSVDSPSLYEPPAGFGSPRTDFYLHLGAVARGLNELIQALLDLERFECSECDEQTSQVGIAECPKCGAPYLDETGS